jgi:hypothetical protein
MSKGSFIDTITVLDFRFSFSASFEEAPRLSCDCNLVLNCGECCDPSNRACRLLNEPLKPAIFLVFFTPYEA